VLAATHTPFVQALPAPQTCPQAPQLFGSDRTLWQTVAPPHLACPTGQLMATHTPFVQALPAPQTCPQAPQLFGSDRTLLQTVAPPHMACPAGQVCACAATAPIAAKRRSAEANNACLAINLERMSVSFQRDDPLLQ
jgi:hypothetical protein